MAAACADDKGTDPAPDPNPDPVPEEYYAGGKLGTAFNTTSVAYEQPTPVVDDDAVMTQRFLNGEALFEKPFTANSSGVRYGLGPLYIRTSCLHCHPGYGHGKRIEGAFNTNQIGNGYLLVITDEDDNYLTSLTGMPQTRAVAPFKAPIDESKIMIGWQEYTDEWGNKFPDGESYSLIYPEVTIPENAYYVPLIGAKGEVPYAKVRVRLESTIGIYGTGLLDAISDSDLKAEYVRQEQNGVPLNPAIFKNGEWVKTYGTTTHPLRYTYALSRGPLQDAAGGRSPRGTPPWSLEHHQRDPLRPPLPLHDRCLCRSSVEGRRCAAGFLHAFPGVEQDGRRRAGYLRLSDEQGTACRDER